MKLIIDIPDEDYNVIIANADFYKEQQWGLPTVWDAIVSGTPLPKGHGDLIDRDKLSHIYRQMSLCSTAPNFIWVSELMKVTPVVEADNSEVD